MQLPKKFYLVFKIKWLLRYGSHNKNHTLKIVHISLMETHNILERLRTAFDPLGVLSSPTSAGKSSPKTAEAASILGMADLVIIIQIVIDSICDKESGLVHAALVT